MDGWFEIKPHTKCGSNNKTKVLLEWINGWYTMDVDADGMAGNARTKLATGDGHGVPSHHLGAEQFLAPLLEHGVVDQRLHGLEW